MLVKLSLLLLLLQQLLLRFLQLSLLLLLFAGHERSRVGTQLEPHGHGCRLVAALLRRSGRLSSIIMESIWL